ncbi:MAG: 50S ribosomal protein L10 [Candidatus Humimicrobiaceae bacterium]
MVKEDKKEKVEVLRKILEENTGIIFTDHTGLTAEDSVIIRDKLAESGGSLRIMKNTLALLAAKDVFSDIDLKEIFVGPTSIVFSKEDIVSIAKAIDKFSEEKETLDIKAGILENNFIGQDKVKKLASLPDEETLLTNLAVSMKSPIIKLVLLLGGLPRNLVMVLNGIKEEKEKNKN